MAKKNDNGIEELESQRDIETTMAQREGDVRLKRALLKKQCRHCGQRAWDVYKTEGAIRYIKCRGCNRNDKIVVATGQQEEINGQQ